jgi:hypothetical protein
MTVINSSVGCSRRYACATPCGGLMKAPKIQRSGKKIPKKNIHPCPFLSVIIPTVNAMVRYRIAPPTPHHMFSLR